MRIVSIMRTDYSIMIYLNKSVKSSEIVSIMRFKCNRSNKVVP